MIVLDENAVAAEIDDLSSMLDVIHSDIETCRQAISLSRGAVAVAVIVVAVVVCAVPAYNTAAVIFPALTAALGGIVWLGASTSSEAALQARRADAEQRRSALLRLGAGPRGWTEGTSEYLH